MDIPFRLVGAARSSDFTRAAAERRRDVPVERCRRRLLGIFTVEHACSPSAAG